MKIIADLNKMQINGMKIEVSHKNETIYFNFAIFNKNNFLNDNLVFKHLNAYWEYKGEYFQEQVFKLYKEIDESFNDLLNKRSLTENLTDLVAKLYEMHTYADMQDWLVKRSGLSVPDGFAPNYEEDHDRKTTIDKTYLRSDYRDLMTLSFMLRLMVPIWSKYTKHIRQHSGNLLKELQSWKLLSKTEIPNLPPVTKLINYIRAKLKKDNKSYTSPVSFISEDDTPYWNMTLICVRKLCVGDLTTREKNANLVTLIHNFIMAQTGYPDGDFANQERPKTPDNFAGEDENKISTMEAFRVSMDISVAAACEIPHSVANLDHTVQLVAYDLDRDLLNRCLVSTSQMMDHPIMPFQRAIVSWVMKNAITPIGFDYLDKDKQVECLGLVQATLWQRGFKYIALLVTAVTSFNNEHFVPVAPTKERLSPEVLKEIRQVFPHVRVIQNRKSEAKEECRVINDMEAIVDELFAHLWQPTASIEMLREVLGPDATPRRIHIRPDIRLRLAELVLAVGRDQISNPTVNNNI